MVLIYSLLFGCFISFFGAVVGYFSLLEDELFKRYQREGDIVYAQVVSYEFTRRGADVKCCDVHALTSMASQKEANTEQHRSNFEYVVVVEYERQHYHPMNVNGIQEMYKTRIRKRVKAQEGDFIEKELTQKTNAREEDEGEGVEYAPSPLSPALSSSPIPSYHLPLPLHILSSQRRQASSPSNPLSHSSRQLLQAASSALITTGSRDEGLAWITPSSSRMATASAAASTTTAAAAIVDVSILDANAMDSRLRSTTCSFSNTKIENMEDLSMVRRPEFEYLELYVLRDYPKSGLPRRFVDRACSLRYRLSTLGLMVFDLALVAFCIKLAANAVLDLPDHHQRRMGWYAMLSFLLLLAMELPLIHWLLKGWLESALREEYLEHADVSPWAAAAAAGEEDSSLSSAESDAYLYVTRW